MTEKLLINGQENLDKSEAPKLPDVAHIASFVDQEILYDSFVRQSFEEGYMTRDELVIAGYVKTYCDINEQEDPSYDQNKMDKKMDADLEKEFNARGGVQRLKQSRGGRKVILHHGIVI